MRNHFVHLDDHGPAWASGSDLLKIVRLLEIIIEANLLLDLGLENELVKSLILASHRLSSAG